ncbi:amino acid ABC transporter substrate-binding protein [Candidatus Poriferisodalis sp.]|uniref:amino acid ABC transporter substrate-binding protein n=1 Tax=Candidatus Poriferisodalis sp. TaxID=3101277 RepID=UPI003C6F0EAE
MRTSGPARALALLISVLLLAVACTGSDGDDGFDGTVRLGAALSETGGFAMEGSDSRQGYDTWVRWVNEEYGGIRIGDARYKAEIIYYDDESDADTAAELVQQLMDGDKVDFLLGPYSSSLTSTASAVAEASEVIMVEGNGTSDTLFDRGFRNLFLVATAATDYTRSGIEALAARGARTAVIAHEDTPFATSVAAGARHHLETNGIEVLTVEAYPEGVADVSDLMAKLDELDPDVFVGGGHYNDAVLFLRSAQELGIRPDAMLITVGPSNPQLVDDLGASVNGVLGPSQWEPAMAYEGSYFGSAADYADYYESLWGERPVYQAASSTAAALALHLAIEAAGDLDTDEVRDALRELDVETFYGPIRFDERGVNVAKPMGTVQVQDGQIVVVAPDAAAVGSSSIRCASAVMRRLEPMR